MRYHQAVHVGDGASGWFQVENDSPGLKLVGFDGLPNLGTEGTKYTCFEPVVAMPTSVLVGGRFGNLVMAMIVYFDVFVTL